MYLTCPGVELAFLGRFSFPIGVEVLLDTQTWVPEVLIATGVALLLLSSVSRQRWEMYAYTCYTCTPTSKCTHMFT